MFKYWLVGIITILPVYPDVFGKILNEAAVSIRATDAEDKFSTFLLICIPASPKDRNSRDVLRNTWLKLVPQGEKTFRHKFTIGLANLSEQEIDKLHQENEQHDDLVFLDDFFDDFGQITGKVLHSMHAIWKLYKFQYLLKGDCDAFVQLPQFIEALKAIGHPNLYWGHLKGDYKPVKTGKYAEFDWILCDHYLPFQLGGSYVLSYKLVDFIARNKDLFKLYRNEDVSVGAWLAGLDVHYVHDNRFDLQIPNSCNNKHLVRHRSSPAMMRHYYSKLMNGEELCENEHNAWKSYVYNFLDSPMNCCKISSNVSPTSANDVNMRMSNY